MFAKQMFTQLRRGWSFSSDVTAVKGLNQTEDKHLYGLRL